ncbi:unnamed protein product, partial [Timema podura]|nr:unnamed protein product [Timema podura]
MYGKKIEQLREAMTTILSDLRPGDFFSIITFSTCVEVWNPEHNRRQEIDHYYYRGNKGRITQQESLRSSVVPVTPDNIRIAKEFVGRLQVGSKMQGRKKVSTVLKVALEESTPVTYLYV